MPPPLALIGAASGWGAGHRETEDGPPALERLGLAAWLAANGIPASWSAMIRPEISWRAAPDRRGAQTFGLVARHNAALAEAVAAAMARERFPVVIGGDHAIAMGSWAGVARGLHHQPFGLLWFDAHLDAHTVETSPSMNAHGMSAAALLGYGDPLFLALCGGALRPEHLCYIGVRSYEAGELALLRRLGVRIVMMDEVKRRGLAAVVAEAVALVTRDTAGFGITIDLDGFEPEDAPGIGLKTPDGLRAAEMLAALAPLARHPGLRALEIVEYIPDFDEGFRTAHLVRDLILALRAPVSAPASATVAP